MSLTLTGKTLGVTTENVQPRNGGSAFISTTIHVLDGVTVHEARTSADFPPAHLPKEGESVTLEVVVSAFATRAGAGYRLTAVKRVHEAISPVPSPAPLKAASGS